MAYNKLQRQPPCFLCLFWQLVRPTGAQQRFWKASKASDAEPGGMPISLLEKVDLNKDPGLTGQCSNGLSLALATGIHGCSNYSCFCDS